MARTTGPLMSLDASGSVAKTIVFSKWKGRNYVRQLVTPANPRAALQVSTRAMMKFLSQAWTPDLSGANMATWDALAASDAISPFNAFVRYNLANWTQFLLPAKAYPRGATGTVPTWTTLPTVTGGVRQATVSFDVNALNQGWGLAIFRSLTTGFTPARDNLVGIFRPLTTAAAVFIDTPIAAGTYFWNFLSFTADGAVSTALGEKTAIVT